MVWVSNANDNLPIQMDKSSCFPVKFVEVTKGEAKTLQTSITRNFLSHVWEAAGTSQVMGSTENTCPMMQGLQSTY